MSQTETKSTEAPKGFKELSDIPARKVFAAGADAVEACKAHVAKILETPAAKTLPMVVFGVTPDGSVDWSKYEGNDIYVIMLRNKTNDDAKRYRALVIQPAPTKAAFLTSPESKDWIADLLETQIAHKLVRTLRAPTGDAEKAISEAEINQIPHTIADYVATHRLGGAVALWNKNAKAIIDALSAKVGAFAEQKFTKDLLRMAIVSKPFAKTLYPALEERSIFVHAANALIKKGRDEGSDVSLVESWLANREQVTAANAQADIPEDFDAEDILF